jgi:energy-coupling factor transporter ATP-binding protein EcfA2
MESEIRDSQIRKLLEKVQRQSFEKYLLNLRLERIRAFSGASITFDFPVTALIGPNGSGKSTILNSAACAYRGSKPEVLFRKSRVGDEAMDNWRIESEVVDKTINPKGTVRGSLTLNGNAWTRTGEFVRECKMLTISRTLPAFENPNFTLKKRISIHGDLGTRKVSISEFAAPNLDRVKRESVSEFLADPSSHSSSTKSLS